MINPYAPSAVDFKSDSRSQDNNPIESLFWLKHFFIFQLSFAFIWICLACVNGGIAAFVEMAIATPHELFVLPTVGTAVWVLHAILALAYRRMRRVRASMTAIVGSSFWLFGMLIFECLTKILPQKLSIALSWTPEVVLLSLYSTLSIFAVWLVVCYSDRYISMTGATSMNGRQACEAAQ